MAVKRISEFPVVEAIGVHVFGRKDDKNVQTILDIKQSIGVIGSNNPPSKTSLVSEEAISKSIGVLESVIQEVDNKDGSKISIGVDIKNSDNSTLVSKTETIGEALQKVISQIGTSGTSTDNLSSPNRTIAIGVNSTTNSTTLDVIIDDSLDNRLKVTSKGLKVDSENYWIKLL